MKGHYRGKKKKSAGKASLKIDNSSEEKVISTGEGLGERGCGGAKEVKF